MMFEVADDTPRIVHPAKLPKDSLEIVFDVLAVSALATAGVAARMALLDSVQENEFFLSSTVVTVNSIGCFVMGILWGGVDIMKYLPYTYVGCVAGFCGSFTTFSSWMNSVVNDQDPVVQCFTGLTIPFTVFLVGVDLSSWIDIDERFQAVPPIAARSLDRGIVACLSLVAVLTLVTIAATGVNTISNGDLISVALGPVGALLRYGLVRWLNPVWSGQFMLGTFIANASAVLVMGGLTHCANGDNWCDYTETGFCGSLSSVSSWVLDTVRIYKTSSKRWAYFYCLFSVGVGIAIMIPFKQ